MGKVSKEKKVEKQNFYPQYMEHVDPHFMVTKQSEDFGAWI